MRQYPDAPRRCLCSVLIVERLPLGVDLGRIYQDKQRESFLTQMSVNQTNQYAQILLGRNRETIGKKKTVGETLMIGLLDKGTKSPEWIYGAVARKRHFFKLCLVMKSTECGQVEGQVVPTFRNFKERLIEQQKDISSTDRGVQCGRKQQHLRSLSKALIT